MKSLSRSTRIMFIFDLIILLLSTYFVGYYFAFDLNILLPTIVLVAVVGLWTLFLKGNYKIREFNITFWNFYRLLEGYRWTAEMQNVGHEMQIF